MASLSEVQQRAGVGVVLFIEELTPCRPDVKPRSIYLTSTSLPFRPSSWAGKQRVTTSWYSGNPEASQQVLGPQELPSTWSGMWRRTQLGRHPVKFTDENGVEKSIVSPMKLREIFEDIGRCGSRLRVTFYMRSVMFVGAAQAETTEESRIVREGIMSTWDFPIDTDTDIGWTCGFEWAGRGQAQAAVVGSRDDEDLTKTGDALSAANEALKDFIDSKIRTIAGSKIPKAPNNFTLGKLEQLAAAPQNLVKKLTRDLQANVNNVKRAANLAQTIRSTPYTIGNTVVNFARNTVSVCNQINDQLGQQPPEAKVLKGNVGALLRGNKYLEQISEQTRLNARAGQQADDQVRRVICSGMNRGTISVRESSSTRAGDIIGVHMCREGDTPQIVSMRYYRVADQGASILRANRLPLHLPVFKRGQILIIPALTNAAAQGTSS